MEDLTELLKKREDLESQISNTRNAKVLAEVADLEAEISNFERERVEAVNHRNAEDPKLLEQIEYHESEKVRLKDIYFGNTYKIQDLEAKRNHFSALKREKLACISEESNN